MYAYPSAYIVAKGYSQDIYVHSCIQNYKIKLLTNIKSTNINIIDIWQVSNQRFCFSQAGSSNEPHVWPSLRKRRGRRTSFYIRGWRLKWLPHATYNWYYKPLHSLKRFLFLNFTFAASSDLQLTILLVASKRRKCLPDQLAYQIKCFSEYIQIESKNHDTWRPSSCTRISGKRVSHRSDQR